jgi:hypothetical protein
VNSARPFLDRHSPRLFLGLAGLLQLLALPGRYVGKEHDDALYILASQGLLWGEYRLWFIPGHPPNTQFPPGFPALLGPVSFLFPDSLFAYQLFSAFILLLCNAAVWLWLKRRHPPGTALVLALLFALNPLVLSRVGTVMPEPAFLLAALGVLLIWDRDAQGWATGALLLAGYSLRPAALPLWAAVWIALLIHGRRRALIGAVAGPALGLLAWTLWSKQTGGVQEIHELALTYGSQVWDRLFVYAAANARHLAEAWGSTFLPVSWAATSWPFWLGLALLALSLGGVSQGLRPWKKAEPAELFLVFSLLMHLAWSWWFDRYLLVLLPFLYSGLARALPPLQAASRRWTGVLAVVFLGQFMIQGRLWLQADSSQKPELADTYEWIRSHTSPQDIFASAFYGRDVLHTGRVFVWFPAAGSPQDFLQKLSGRRIRYVLWQDGLNLGFSSTENQTLEGLKRLEGYLQDAQTFRLVHADASGKARLYERLNF